MHSSAIRKMSLFWCKHRHPPISILSKLFRFYSCPLTNWRAARRKWSNKNIDTATDRDDAMRQYPFCSHTVCSVSNRMVFPSTKYIYIRRFNDFFSFFFFFFAVSSSNIKITRSWWPHYKMIIERKWVATLSAKLKA